MPNRIQAGSTVKHIPTGEEWFLLGVNKERNRVCIAGWPATIANLSDCELINEGTGITTEELSYRNKEFGYGWD